MDSYIIAYIQDRMRMLGIQEYQFEPFLVNYPGVELMLFTISPNDYYFLVSKELKPGLMIQVASNIYQVTDSYIYSPYSNIMEFNGTQMRIGSGSLQSLGRQFIEFIRVIAYI